METPNLSSPRARKARLGKQLGASGYRAFSILSAIGLASGIALALAQHRSGYSLMGVGILLGLPAIWWQYDLSRVPLRGNGLDGRLSNDCLARLSPGVTYSPRSLWQALRTSWQAYFFTHHLLMMPADQLDNLLSDDPAELAPVWPAAVQLADKLGSKQVETGHVVSALLHSSDTVSHFLTNLKLTEADLDAVTLWLQHDIDAAQRERTNFGGIGRDWANGFTPRLDRFGHNLSLAIEKQGAHFGALVDSPGVTGMKTAFSQQAGALALIGPDGIGKTSHAYALAQNLLAESQDPVLQHKQIIALDASAIISAATRPGELEYILTGLLNEAAHAGNVILFFDDAAVFFQAGQGSFNATQILLPVLHSRAIQLIFAMTAHDYQALKATNAAFASLLIPVALQEQPEAQTLEIICDTATRLELRHKLIITYQAVKEAYRLSGRYETDTAYPGKAISLLEQALAHADGNVITAASVQSAIEQTHGVKTGAAAPVEADQLLHLEDKIHERMINQTRAVEVVASALRRARAGVATPNRPIGSFLFLGPTGVGKTELAKAVAATYFGDEASLTRLDMSEYQQESDVARLLSDGQQEASSLIMRVRQQPFGVVLLDEIEKAHPNILNLLLQLLDEGQLTDTAGRMVSFKDSVIIATSNAGADTIREHIDKGEALESFEQAFTDQLIASGQFRPELLNRFDEIVLFRPLKPDELAQVVRLMLAGTNQTLAAQNITVGLTDAAVAKIVAVGNDPRLGARPMRRTLQRAVENTVANKILKGEAHPGDRIELDAPDLTI